MYLFTTKKVTLDKKNMLVITEPGEDIYAKNVSHANFILKNMGLGDLVFSGGYPLKPTTEVGFNPIVEWDSMLLPFDLQKN